MEKNQNFRAILLIILSGILWGTSCIFVKIWSTLGLSAMEMASIRILMAAPCFLVYTLLFCRKAFRVRPGELLFYAGSGFTMFGMALCYYTAIQKTSVATAVVLMYTGPLLVFLWEVFVEKRKSSPKNWIAFFVMLAGCALISGITDGIALNLAGLLIAFGSSVCYGAYNILTKEEMRRGFNARSTALYSFLFAMLFVFCFCNLSGMLRVLESEPLRFSGIALAHGLFTYALPYFIYTIAIKSVPAGIASSLTIVDPMASTLFGVFLFGETLTVYGILGIFCILGAITVLARQDNHAGNT